MRARYYARDIICDCIATLQSSARQAPPPPPPPPCHSNLRVRHALAANDRRNGGGGRKRRRFAAANRHPLNSDRIYRALASRTFVLISDAAHRLIVVMFCGTLRPGTYPLARCQTAERESAAPCNALSTRFIRRSTEITAFKCVHVDVRLAATYPSPAEHVRRRGVIPTTDGSARRFRDAPCRYMSRNTLDYNQNRSFYIYSYTVEA